MKFFLIIAALLPLSALCADAGNMDIYSHLSRNDTIGDLLEHPAFKGFAEYTLPRESDVSSKSLRIGEVGALMPYHSHVNGDAVIASLNRMIDDAAGGKTIFYRIYENTGNTAEGAGNGAGLFFFRGKPGAPFAVICPGGGFVYAGSLHEGFPYALKLSEKGYNVFVLRYRTGLGGMQAVRDLAAALSFIFKNAGQFEVDTEKYSLWGSSAGARMAAYIGSNGAAVFGGGDIPRPSVIVTAYTGHSEYTRDDAPTFAVVGAGDAIAYPSVMERRIAGMRRAGIDACLREYQGVGHGFGLGIGTPAEGWIENAVEFWEKHMNLSD